MAEIITDLLSKSGISPEMAKRGLGTLFAEFKHALPAQSFAKIERAIPGARNLLADASSRRGTPRAASSAPLSAWPAVQGSEGQAGRRHEQGQGTDW
jgi:hypothetical protein